MVNDNGTLNEEGADSDEIIFPQNNHHQLIKESNTNNPKN